MSSGGDGRFCARCLFGTALAEIVGESGGEAPGLERMDELIEGHGFVREIGRGGMGAVYEAEEQSSGERVAVKVLSREAASNPEFVERFRRESALLSRMRHPRIVGLKDWGERAGMLYLLMEYLPGGDLAQLLKRKGVLGLEEAVDLISQACEGLEYSHSLGVLHRDIKPGNLLLDAQGQIKVGDFGLAKVMGEETSMALTMTHAAMGTPRYMAPEQMGDGGEVDERTDVYALGVVFYEMLTGRLPGGNFALPSELVGVGERVDEVVLKAMSDRAEDRYPSVAAFHRALSGLLKKRRSFGILAGAVVLVIVGISLSLLIGRDGRTDVGKDWELVPQEGEVLPAGFPRRLEGAMKVCLSDASREFGVALMANGSLKGFGDDSYGQASPPQGTGFVDVAVGRGERAAHGVALKQDGRVVAWGDDSFGQASVPEGLPAARAVAAGEFHSVATLESGAVRRWGRLPEVTGEAAEKEITPTSGRSVEARLIK